METGGMMFMHSPLSSSGSSTKQGWQLQGESTQVVWRGGSVTSEGLRLAGGCGELEGDCSRVREGTQVKVLGLSG